MARTVNTKRANGPAKRATHKAIKEQLIVAGKVLVAQGQDDFTRGHISFRLPDNPGLFFMKAHSIGLDEITMQNILTIDLEATSSPAPRAGTARFTSIRRFSKRVPTSNALFTHIRPIRSR